MTGIDVLLLDLDGVVRHFDAGVVRAVERAHGLSDGALTAAAFDRALLRRVTSGAISRAEWVERVGITIGSPAAAQAWAEQRPVVDDAVMRTAEAARVAGLRVCLLTNGTDTIGAELHEHGLTDAFDTVFNSADIGYAKPDLEIYVHVLTALDVAAGRVLYLDDSPAHVRSAAALGIRARLHTRVDDLRSALHAHGVQAGPGRHDDAGVGGGEVVEDESGRRLM